MEGDKKDLCSVRNLASSCQPPWVLLLYEGSGMMKYEGISRKQLVECEIGMLLETGVFLE